MRSGVVVELLPLGQPETPWRGSRGRGVTHRPGSVRDVAAIEDPYREQAEREFYAEVAEGRGYRVCQPLDELGGRSLHEVWTAGDHQAVEQWLTAAYARTDAIAERHRNDPEFMAMIRESQAEVHRLNAEQEHERQARLNRQRTA
jgi:hypothetical protein